MYFRSVDELEVMMWGHAKAFAQLGVLGEREETFGTAFAQWLHSAKQTSGASAGWAYSIAELADAAKVQPEVQLAVCLPEFLLLWLNDATDEG